MGTSSSGGPRIRRTVRTRSTKTGRFIDQGISIELIAGKHVFSSPSRDFSRATTTFELKRQLFAAFDADFFLSFVDGIFLAAHNMVNNLLPTVAFDTGVMRNAIIDLLMRIKSSAVVRQENAFENSTVFEAIIDFQVVWSTVSYSIYHEVIQWAIIHGRSFYKDPSTRGTFPYSKVIFINTFNDISVIETNKGMQAKGWDLKPIIFTPLLEAAA